MATPAENFDVLNPRQAGEPSSASKTHLQRFSVSYEFPVVFTEGLFQTTNPTLKDTVARLEPNKKHRVIVFIDDGITTAIPEINSWIIDYCATFSTHLELTTRPIEIPGGELIKNSHSTINQIRQHIDQTNLDRHSYVVAIGGGAVLDAVGFVAATAHRGIRHIRIPTTVLAQNDSGVGVKNGVNQFGQKNYMGTFAPPFAVLNDFEFLLTLNKRERRDGMAEAIKVALIRDAEFFRWIEAHTDKLSAFNPTEVQHLIQRCAELHMHQIACGGDPFENGSARPLDFGHWAAHKLETLSQHELSHGEAVAIGIAMDAHYSHRVGLLDTQAVQRIYSVLKALGFSLWSDTLEHSQNDGQLSVVQGLVDFQAHLGGELTITLLSSIGQGIEVHTMDDRYIYEAIEWLKQEHQLCN
ncbi:MAG: 3-dehydroquinate synthase [Gammaproteobacteria bacterium]|nr:3-dehydroquinate synthase [Gammaproteobacteria bacterium]